MDDNVAVVRSLFELFNEGRIDEAAGLASGDFELVDVPMGLTLRGPEGLRTWLSMFKTALPDARTELVSVIGQGDQVASEHVGRGTHRGPLETPSGTIPPTGRSVELRIGEIYRLRDGKLTALHAYYDGATMMRQLGLLPPAGSLPERAMMALAATRIKFAGALKRR